jgi:protein-disulfide isomerase
MGRLDVNNALRILFTACLCACSFSAWSASTKQEIINLQTEIASLKAGQEAMQKDLAEIKALVQQGARAAPAAAAAPAFREQVVSIGDAPFRGEAKATLTLIEFSDYQCPFCSRHYQQVMPKIVSDYVDTGKLKYVMFENPISSLHKNAYNASLAALCAGDQGKYWEMHNIMFDNQKELTDDKLKAYAVSIGLKAAEFNACLDTRKYEKQVNSDIATGTRLGVQGTPGFVIGLTDPKDPGQVTASVYIKGAQSFDQFKANIDQLLEPAK